MRPIVPYIGRRNLLDNGTFGGIGGENGVVAVIAAREAKGLDKESLPTSSLGSY